MRAAAAAAAAAGAPHGFELSAVKILRVAQTVGDTENMKWPNDETKQEQKQQIRACVQRAAKKTKQEQKQQSRDCVQRAAKKKRDKTRSETTITRLCAARQLVEIHVGRHARELLRVNLFAAAAAAAAAAVVVDRRPTASRRA